MALKPVIPVFDLPSEARAGLHVDRLHAKVTRNEHDTHSAHRDNHYLLFILKRGSGRIQIDFEEYTAAAPAICLMHPEQVHRLLENSVEEGWLITFDSGLAPPELSRLPNVLPLSDTPADFQPLLEQLLDAFWQIYHSNQTSIQQPTTLHALLSTLLHLIINSQPNQLQPNPADHRSAEILEQFRHLVKQHYIAWKRPAQYAEALYLSVNHLNDIVREKTGFTVTHWIQHHTMLEARRLLYYTQLTSKEVAHRLGYDDPHYFSRLFKKVTRLTPVDFRQRFRDLSTESRF